METLKKGKFHYAWLIMVSCFFLYGGTMGMGYNCGGVFNAAISRAMGWTISGFTFSTIFLGAASTLTLVFVDRIFNRFHMKAVLGISIVIYGISLMLKCICSEIWQFCILYAVNGAAAAFLFYVPVPMLINRWFKKKAGFALGLSLLSSGVAGAVMNPILSAIIEAKGWQTAAVVNGIVSIVFALPPVLLFVKKCPEEMGLKPYGAEDPSGDSAAATSVSEDAEIKPIHPREQRICFVCSFVLAMIVLVISMIPQQLAHFAQVNGISAAIGASLVSVGMAGNMTSKAIMGGCVDRFGTKKTFTASFLLVALGFLVYAVLPDASLFLLYPAAFLTGVSAANNVVVMPFMVKAYTDSEDYLFFMSRVSMATMIATAFGTYICSAIYDLTGSYTWEFLLYIAADLIALGLVYRIISAEKKRTAC